MRLPQEQTHLLQTHLLQTPQLLTPQTLLLPLCQALQAVWQHQLALSLSQNLNCQGHLQVTPTQPLHPPPSLLGLFLQLLLQPTQHLQLPPTLSPTLTPTPTLTTLHSMQSQHRRLMLLKQSLHLLGMKKSHKLQALKGMHQLQTHMATPKDIQTLPTHMPNMVATQILRQGTPTPMTLSRHMGMMPATMAMTAAAMHSMHRLLKGRLQRQQPGWPLMPLLGTLAPLQAPPRRIPKLMMESRPSQRHLLCKSSCRSSMLRSSRQRSVRKKSARSKSSCGMLQKQKPAAKQLQMNKRQQLLAGPS